MVFIQKSQVSSPVLTSTINAKDDKQETALIKAVRLANMEMVFALMQRIGPTDLLAYQTLTQTDLNGRNVLHHAVMGKHKELVERFVKMDVDHQTLRN